MTTLPNRKALENNPSIVVAGLRWPVPLLAPRQSRIILPAFLKLGDGAADYALMLDIVFAALTRACPDLSREEFENWPIPFVELRDALSIIADQTGMMRRATTPSSRKPSPPDFDAIIAQVCNFLPGTTPDYWEDALTGPRFDALNEEWRLHPPVAVLVAGFLGYKPKSRGPESLEELMRLFPNGQLKLN